MGSVDTTKVPPGNGPASPPEGSAEDDREVPTSIRISGREMAAIDFVVRLNPKFNNRTDALREHSIKDCQAMQANAARELTGTA